MYASCNLAEVVKFLFGLNDNVVIHWICRLKSYCPLPCILFPVPCILFPVPCILFPVPCSLFPESFHREIAVDAGDDDVAVGGADGAVDDEDVAVVDSGTDHGVARDANEVGGGGALDEKLVEVERRLDVLFGGGGEAGYDGSGWSGPWFGHGICLAVAGSGR